MLVASPSRRSHRRRHTLSAVPYAAALLLSLASSSNMSATDALSTSIVVVGLNAALQKRFILEPSAVLVPGSVHRAERTEEGVGGKGQDVAVALSCLAADNKKVKNDAVLLAQFIGSGAEGDAVLSTLASKHSISDDLTVRPASKMRTCTTIVASDASTELVEPSGVVTEGEMDELMAKIDALAGSGAVGGGKKKAASALCVMGSMPPGCPPETYAELHERTADGTTLALLDTVVGLDELLSSLAKVARGNIDGGGKGGGAVLKVNAAELCRLAGVVKESGGEADRVSYDEICASVGGLLGKFKDAGAALDFLAITDGRHPAYLVKINGDGSSPFKTWRMDAVDLGGDQTLFPIGAGDTVAAGTLAAWQYLHSPSDSVRGAVGVVGDRVGGALAAKRDSWGFSDDREDTTALATAFAFGLSCGSASCLQQENSVFDVDDAVRLFDGMAKPTMM